MRTLSFIIITTVCTKPRFHNEVKSNSEMTYLVYIGMASCLPLSRVVFFFFFHLFVVVVIVGFSSGIAE